MTESLNGRVAAVTGAASGIGLACARRLHSAGAKVVLIDRAEDALAEACAQLGDGAFSLCADLLDGTQVDSLLDGILSAAGGLDIFHANAGAYVGGSIAEGDPDAWELVLNLNVGAAFRSVRAVLPHLIAQGTGDIVMTSSVAGVVPIVGEPVYTASKFAVTSFVHALRRQVAPQGVRVGNVAPGPVLTPLLGDWSPAELQAAVQKGAVMAADEVAEAVLFMVTRPAGVTVRDLVILPTALDV